MFDIDEQRDHELMVTITLHKPRQVQMHSASDAASSSYWGFIGHIAGTKTGQKAGIGNLPEPCEGFKADA